MREDDKRNFKRYTSRSECEVTLPSGTYKGRIIDYSDGVGVELENAPAIKQGTEIYIRVLDHDLVFRGTIAWVRTEGQQVRAGVRRTDTLKGNLRDFRFPDILIGISRSAWTGTLTIKRGSLVRNIFIDKGDIIFASSNNKDDRLGERLVKKGKISLTEYENASKLLMKTGKKLGKILVELCYLTPSELFQLVRQQIEDIIISHFEWEEGEFVFQKGPITSDEVITLQISMANIICRGIKKIDNLELIKQMCPSVDDILNPSHNPVRIFQSLDLNHADKKILSYINGIYPVKTILSLSPTTNFETLKTLSALMSIGLIYVKEERDAPLTLQIEEIFGKPEEMAPQDFLEKIEEVFLKCKTLGYYEALGVAKDASMEEIESAYFQLLKQFHPDRHFSFPSLDIKDKLLKIISYISEGYEILSDPMKREEHDRALAMGVTPGMSEETRTQPSAWELCEVENQNPVGEGRSEGTMHIDLPDDIISSGGNGDAETTEVEEEEVPAYNLSIEVESGGNGSNEEAEHMAVFQDYVQNATGADNSGVNGQDGAKRDELPEDNVSSGIREDTVALSELQMSGRLTVQPPSWVFDPSFRTPEENALHKEIADISKKIGALEQERKDLEHRIDSSASIRALLYEQGNELELAVLDALTILGFSARPLEESGSDCNIIFESPEGRCLGNVEGKDNMAIDIDRFSQLERNLQEDFAREGVEEYAKGVIIGNAERLRPPSDRGETFTVKCVTAAKRVRIALVRTSDLLGPVGYLRSHPDPDYAKICREAIFNAEGDVVAFPPASVSNVIL
ncbi:MAG: DUF4388 domain-containing protein [Nitrospirota bacterium]